MEFEPLFSGHIRRTFFPTFRYSLHQLLGVVVAAKWLDDVEKDTSGAQPLRIRIPKTAVEGVGISIEQARFSYQGHYAINEGFSQESARLKDRITLHIPPDPRVVIAEVVVVHLPHFREERSSNAFSPFNRIHAIPPHQALPNTACSHGRTSGDALRNAIDRGKSKRKREKPRQLPSTAVESNETDTTSAM